MPRPLKFLAVALALVGGTFALQACGYGSEEVAVKKGRPDYAGAVLFSQRCGGCHTLDAAGTQGTTKNKRDRERVDGPTLKARKEKPENVLYAIRNGGFSGAIMPQNIVTGKEADEVAQFVAHNAGKDAKRTPLPTKKAPGGF